MSKYLLKKDLNVPKKAEKKLKSDSEPDSDSDSDSDSEPDSDSESGSDTFIPKKTKITPKKSNVKQEKEELCKKFNDEFDKLFDSKKHKNLIDKITVHSMKVSKKNIIDAINKTQDEYNDISSLCDLINILWTRYNIPDDVYIELFSKKFTCTKYQHVDLVIPLTTDFKNSLYDLVISKKMQGILYFKNDGMEMSKLTNIEYKNFFHIYLMLNYELTDIKWLMVIKNT
jgi:hypothetical protein